MSMSSGVKVLVLAVIVGIGSSIFGEFHSADRHRAVADHGVGHHAGLAHAAGSRHLRSRHCHRSGLGRAATRRRCGGGHRDSGRRDLPSRAVPRSPAVHASPRVAPRTVGSATTLVGARARWVCGREVRFICAGRGVPTARSVPACARECYGRGYAKHLDMLPPTQSSCAPSWAAADCDARQASRPRCIDRGARAALLRSRRRRCRIPLECRTKGSNHAFSSIAAPLLGDAGCRSHRIRPPRRPGTNASVGARAGAQLAADGLRLSGSRARHVGCARLARRSIDRDALRGRGRHRGPDPRRRRSRNALIARPMRRSPSISRTSSPMCARSQPIR